MILLRRSKLEAWLSSIEKDHNWLAGELHIGKSYVSQIIHNRCKMSRPTIEKLMALTHMDFGTLFYTDSEIDDREFFGKEIGWHRKLLTSDEYNARIDEILDKAK